MQVALLLGRLEPLLCSTVPCGRRHQAVGQVCGGTARQAPRLAGPHCSAGPCERPQRQLLTGHAPLLAAAEVRRSSGSKLHGLRCMCIWACHAVGYHAVYVLRHGLL